MSSFRRIGLSSPGGSGGLIYILFGLERSPGYRGTENYLIECHHSRVMTDQSLTNYLIDTGPSYLQNTQPRLEPQVIEQGALVIDGLLEGHRLSMERTVQRMSATLADRLTLHDEALQSIDSNRIEIQNLIHSIYRPGQPATENPDYLRLRLEKLKLDRDHRREMVDCWRDSIETTKEIAGLLEKIEQAKNDELLIQGGAQ